MLHVRQIRKLSDMAASYNPDQDFATRMLRVHHGDASTSQKCWEETVEMFLDTDGVRNLVGSAAADEAEELAIGGLYPDLSDEFPVKVCVKCGKSRT